MSCDPNFTQLDIERATGLSREVLRKWELRYGFPVPQRGPRGQRMYSAADLERLQWIQRLMRKGVRPGKLLVLSLQQLHELLVADANRNDTEGTKQRAVNLVLQSLLPEAPLSAQHSTLQNLIDQNGLDNFAQILLPALNGAIGDAWASGRLPVHGEHRYTEVLRNVMQEAIAKIPLDPRLPRIVLSTPPSELHGLGLMSLQAVFALEGVQCISLGTQMPATEIVLAARAYAAEVVALSVSVCTATQDVHTFVQQIRMELPSQCVVWVGGRGAQALEPVPGVLVFESVGQALQVWRDGMSAPMFESLVR